LYNLDLTQDYTPTELISKGCIDAIRVFVKNEPHKESKLLDARQRLIFSVSIIDNIICELLSGNQNKKEIENWDTIPPQCGFGLNDDQILTFLNSIKTEFLDEKFYDDDISGWDFSVDKDNYDFDLFRRRLLNNGDGTSWWKIISAHYYCMQRKVVTIDDGRCFAQTYHNGIMGSGWKNTSSANSSMRVGDAWLCRWKLEGNLKSLNGKAGCKTHGVDILEKYIASPDDIVDTYRGFGKAIKQVNVVHRNDFEFCSTRFVNGIAYPLNEDKQLFNLLNFKPQSELEMQQRYFQFKHEFRHSPNKSKLLAVVVMSGWLTQFVEGFKIGSVDFSFQNEVLTKMPRDCTGTYLEVDSILQMYSPYCHEVSNTMTNKSKQKKANVTRAKPKSNKNQVPQSKPKKKSTPFSDVGGTLGTAIGSMFGGPGVGRNVGRWLGSGIGSIFGSGDYTMIGSDPKYNVLTNGAQIPKFSSTHATNIICHREYLGDIIGTAGFNNVLYPLNPGISSTFPWLSTVAEAYQEYRFHGLIFEFRPLITDFVTSGAPGVIIMATNYNADLVAYANKQQMENSEFAVSVKPTKDLIHGVECATQQTILPQRFVRTGSVPVGQDLRLYDYGNFQFATQQNPIQDLGELWVSYCVEFFKPVLPGTIGGNVASAKYSRTGGSGLAPLGTVTTNSSGTISLTLTSTTLQFTTTLSSKYMIEILYVGTAATFAVPSVSITNGIFLSNLNNNASPNLWAPNTGAVADTIASFTGIIQATSLTSNIITVTFGTAGTLPTASNVDIIVTQLDNTVV
jgi:hypothetical protein